jgi:hypothetical protein
MNEKHAADAGRMATDLDGNWRELHERLVTLARAKASLDFEVALELLAARRSGVHARLGYGSFVEYVERLFGYGGRVTQDKLRVAEALEALPALSEALKTGSASWSIVRELTRVATPETEREWLEAARGRTVREVEKLVSGHVVGSRPSDKPDPRIERHILRFEVSGEALATFREALAQLRRDAGEPLDDDAALLLLARKVLGGPGDDGRASYQVALTVCEHCRQGIQHGGGEPVVVAPEIVEMADCDEQCLGHLDAHVGADIERASQDTPPAIRRAVIHRDGGCCVVPGCRHGTFVDVHHLHPKSENGSHEPANLITLCGAHHRAIHRGALRIAGSIAAGLQFWHADGTVYGTRPSAIAVDAHTRAFQALRKLGFSESETKQALAHVGASDSLEQVLRQALQLLTRRIAQAS